MTNLRRMTTLCSSANRKQQINEQLTNPMEILPFSHINDGISIPCVKCDEYVEVRSLQKHRELHRVWRILHCTADTVPKTMKQLLKKRRQIINSAILKLGPGSPLPAKVLQKIDWAFEIARSIISDSTRPFVNDNGTYKPPHLSVIGSSEEETRPEDTAINSTVEGTSEQLEHCGQSVGVCSHSNTKWRTTNEDRYFHIESSFLGLNHSFFGLFDGYNGSTAAEKCSNKFYDFLRDELTLYTNRIDPEEPSESQQKEREDFVKQAIRNSFFKMDSYLLTGESESSKIRWSGTSATVCYIESDTLYVANSGSVRALFVKDDGSAISLVKDHTLKSKKERDRILKANGSISISSRTSTVNGLLSSTRGLGNHGDPKLKTAIISSPSITVSKIDPNDQFLVLFTAGISDIFNDEEVMFLLEDIMPDASEIENLKEHFANRSQMKKEQVATRISGMDEVSFDENKESFHLGDQPIDNITDNEDITAHTTATVNAHDYAIGDKNTSISFEDKSFELDMPKRKGRLPHESKPCFLARALVERLVYSAILADTRENTSSMVILLHGCPINLYLLPNVKRKSLFLRDLPKKEIDSEKEGEYKKEGTFVMEKHLDE